MIDQPDMVERIMAQMNNALPIPARMTPEVRAALHGKDLGDDIPMNCTVIWISYGGDEAGIVCKLDLGNACKNAAFVSITHLRFDPRSPLARQIVAYQKHRVKHLRRQAA